MLQRCGLVLMALLLMSAATAAVGKDAPDLRPELEIETLDDGHFSLAARRGGWVVVNFWATWCAPCLLEMPELSRFHNERDDVEVIGLAFEETTAETLREFLKRRPVSYPIALVDPFEPMADFEVPRGLPLTWMIAPDGSVARKFMGPVTAEELALAISDHEAGS